MACHRKTRDHALLLYGILGSKMLFPSRSTNLPNPSIYILLLTFRKMGCRISINLKEHLSPKVKRKSSDSTTSPMTSPLTTHKDIDTDTDTVSVDLDAPDNEYI